MTQKRHFFEKFIFWTLLRHWPSTGQVFKKLKSIPNVIGANEISKYLISKACFQIWSKFMTPFSFSNLKKPEYVKQHPNICWDFKKHSLLRNHLKFSNWGRSDRVWSNLAILLMSQEKSRGQLKWLQNVWMSINWHIVIKSFMFITLPNKGFRHFGGVAESFASKILYESRSFNSNLQSAIRNLIINQLFRNKTSWIVLKLTRFRVFAIMAVAPLCKQCVWV